MSKLTELEQVIGYEFNEQRLLQQALTHSSFANEKHMKKLSDNERLEFLGDAVLEVVSSEFLYKEHTDLPEGRSDQSCARASSVSRRLRCAPGRLTLESICIWARGRI